MKINVLSVVGPHCMTYEGGHKLHDAYRAAFDAGKIVELDFTGTRFFVSQFFNAAVGQLLKDYSKDEIRRRLIFENLPEPGREAVKRSVENAEKYYKDPRYQEALDRVLTAESTRD
jgi:hypothetical protein